MQSTAGIMGRIIISLSGTTLLDAEKELIAHPNVAGIILFAQNYQINGRKLLLQLIAAIQKAAIDAGKLSGIPIFADQEGGFVQRIGKGSVQPIPANYVLGLGYDINAEYGMQLSKKVGWLMAEELGKFGIISLSPVLDLQLGNTIIEGLGRSFHKDPKSCYKLAEAYIDGMQAAGMRATGKHYPGHGLDIGDSHVISPTDDRTLTELEEGELFPFIQLIKANKLAAIMPSHITYPKIDADNIAGMSQIWINDLLRNKYGFKGVIISDCLTMAGAGNYSDVDKIKNTLKYLDVALLCHKTVDEYLAIFNELGSEYYMNTEQKAAFNHWISPSITTRLNLCNGFNPEMNNLLVTACNTSSATTTYYQANGVADPQTQLDPQKMHLR